MSTTTTTPTTTRSPDDDDDQHTGLCLQPGKATKQMEQSLSKLKELLRCPLCKKIFEEPVTLCACAHTFCTKCIDQYTFHSWKCPMEECHMPLSITGGRCGKYRKRNPQLAQTVESLHLVYQALNQSPNQWWKLSETCTNIQTLIQNQRQSEIRMSQSEQDDDEE